MRPVLPPSEQRRLTRSAQKGMSLERRFEPSAGIRFDTTPQTGDWLHVETTGSDSSSPNHTGMYLKIDQYGRQDDFTSYGDWMINMDAGGDHGSEFRLNGDAGSALDLYSGGSTDFLSTAGMVIANDDPAFGSGIVIEQKSDGGNLAIKNDGDGFIDINDSGASGGGVSIASVANDITVALGVGKKLVVVDSASNPVFEVRDDGSVHILTGGTIVADL